MFAHIVQLVHAGIVQEANLSMVHLASNKASEQYTLWQVEDAYWHAHIICMHVSNSIALVLHPCCDVCVELSRTVQEDTHMSLMTVSSI